MRESRALTLATDAGLEAAFVPSAGMVGCSLRDHGEELLGQRGGLRHYIEQRSTMGIPLLYPWANRVAADEVLGRRQGGRPGLSLGCRSRSGRGDCRSTACSRQRTDGRWTGTRRRGTAAYWPRRFDFAAHEELIAAFPFPHRVRWEATLEGTTLTIATTIDASGDVPVPVSFGYHPYLRLPGVDRADWEVTIPVRERLELDRRMIPTGEREPVDVKAGPLGERTFDDEYLAPPDAAPFVLAGGGRRIELCVGPGYRFAQVYAPGDDDVVAFEPMTAPTNALVTGGPDLPLVAPGGRYEAIFSITVSDRD